MIYSTKGYSTFLDGVLSDEDSISEQNKQKIIAEHNKIVDEEYKKKLQEKCYNLILSLFTASYIILIATLSIVYFTEISLIKSNLLSAENRSINSMTVSALIAGTIAQTGIAFLTVTNFLFKEKKLDN
jgi:hypothetical protein